MLKSVTRWLPYAVYPSDRATGRPEPTLLELRLPAGASDWLTAFATETVDTVHEWPLDVVWTALADRALAWHQQSTSPRDKRTATAVELRQWIVTTQGLADRLPFVGVTAGMMRTAAAHLTRTLDSPQQFFRQWPSLGTTADAAKRASLHLWAIDQLRRHINDTEAEYARERGSGVAYVTFSHTAIWPALFPTDDRLEGPAFADYNDARKRVGLIDTSLRPGAGDGLMMSILHDALTHTSASYPTPTKKT